MHIKFVGQAKSGIYQNTGSCREAIEYNQEKTNKWNEIREDLGIDEGLLSLFDMQGSNVNPETAIRAIDSLHRGLLKTERKFYGVIISPSDKEILAMGQTLNERLQNGRRFVLAVMDAYARHFQRPQIIDRSSLVAYATAHLSKKRQEGMQLHWQVVVARKDITNTFKLSPRTNHRNTLTGPIVGGFTRVAFYSEVDRIFDSMFDYQRTEEEFFDYLNENKKTKGMSK